MLVSEVPFSFRRPDVIVYRCVEEPRGKWKTMPTAADAVLVVEVVSPGTITADLRDKRTEYGALGIPHYWIVRMAQNGGPAVSVERLRLLSDGTYGTDGVGMRSHGPAIETLDRSRSASAGRSSTRGWTNCSLSSSLIALRSAVPSAYSSIHLIKKLSRS